MHNLRHSMASNMVNAGRSIYEVAKTLGHAQLKTSQRYSHLSNETLLAAVDAAAGATGTVWGAGPEMSAESAEVRGQPTRVTVAQVGKVEKSGRGVMTGEMRGGWIAHGGLMGVAPGWLWAGWGCHLGGR